MRTAISCSCTSSTTALGSAATQPAVSFLNNWVKSFTDNLKDDQWGMYINYADPTLSKSDAQKWYYRSSLPRLQQVKAAVDPTELFYYPQSITPAK